MDQTTGSWRFDDATVARLLCREDLASHWIFGHHLVTHPGEAAMWMKDGKVTRIVTEGNKAASGVVDRLKSLFFAKGNLVVMMMDTSDIFLNFRMGVDKETVFAGDSKFYGELLDAYGQRGEKDPDQPGQQSNEKSEEDQDKVSDLVDKYSKSLDDELKSRKAILTRDQESVAFDVRLTINLLPEMGVNFFKLFGAKKALGRPDITFLARGRLETAIFVPSISKHTAAQLRQDLEILADINQAANEEMAKWLPEHGIGLKRLAINPALTGEERKAIIKRERQSLSSAAVHRHQHDLAELEMEYGRLVMREKLAVGLEQAKADKDEEKQKIIQATFLANQKKELSAAQVADKIERVRISTKLEAQKKLRELEILGVRRKWEIQKERLEAEASLEMDKMRILAEEYRKNKELKALQKLREMELRHEEAQNERKHIENLLEMGADKGALTNGVLKEAIRQQSVRKALDQGDGVGRAFGEAEGRRLESQDQKDLPGQPAISITGQGPMIVKTGGGPDSTGRQLLAGPHPALPAPNQDETVVTICPNCGEPIPDGSAFCGNCGKKLGE